MYVCIYVCVYECVHHIYLLEKSIEKGGVGRNLAVSDDVRVRIIRINFVFCSCTCIMLILLYCTLLTRSAKTKRYSLQIIDQYI